MTDPKLPHDKHSDDAVADDGPPTDGLTDEVRTDSAKAGPVAGENFPDLPAQTHP